MVRRFSELQFTGRFIAVCFAIFILYWIITAFSAKPTVKGYRREWRLLWLATTVIGVLLLPLIRAQRLGIGTAVPQTLPVQLTADAVTFCGLILTLWARTILGGNWSSGVVLKENHELMERGPYAYIRHPIYSGALLMLAGLIIYLGNLGGLLLFALCFAGFWVKLRLEEKLLTTHFSDAYLQYKRRTKALIPFIL